MKTARKQILALLLALALLTETPIQILVGTACAVALVFIGNYFLEMIINLFSYPYSDIVGESVVNFGITQSINRTLLAAGTTVLKKHSR